MSENILIVDDDPNVVEILTESLKDRGYNTESAYDGEEALEKYDSFRPDLVVLDVVLPKKDGFNVCDEIRARDIHKDIPVIMISADSIPEAMAKGFRSGAQDYIKKPFSLKEIIAKIDNFLHQANKRKDLREQNILLEDEVQKGQEDYMWINRELKKKILDMRTLFGLSQDLNRLRDPEELVNVFSLTIIGQLCLGSASIFYALDDMDDHLSYAGGKGVQDNVLKTVRLSREMGLSMYLLQNQDVLDLTEPNLPEDTMRESKFMVGFGFNYCFPLVVKSKLIGIVFVGRKVNDQEYSVDDMELFKSICCSAATGLENARLYSELQATYLSTIKVLVSTIEAKDSYTRGHTERVAGYARMLAQEMDLSKKDREIVSFGAVLHDIGKLGVYENILNKPGKLTDHEWEIVRSHPEVGANIIK
ncbi:MAG: response regulator, partial [Candidatus Krumholzibacteria bacterium]|nr:response regulator [Candidatus Krumholzibacteria bacterium]